MLNKQRVLEELLGTLRLALTELANYANAAAAGAVHEESRAENDKDTRGLETSYLARGQAQRTVELEGAIRSLEYMPLGDFTKGEPIASSALVKLQRDDVSDSWVFISPWGGGVVLDLEGVPVRVIGPQSPLGRALLGKSVEDYFELVIRGERVEFEIIETL